MTTALQGKILQDIIAERNRQDDKWGKDRDHLMVEWLSILGEEYGEICKATNELHWELDSDARVKKYKNLEEELIQTAAVCIATLESLANYGFSGVEEIK